MKKILSLFGLTVLIITFSYAQSNIGIGTTTPSASAMLDVTASNKGFLMPRIALTSVTDAVTIPSPAMYLMVMNTNASLPDGIGLYVNMGTPSVPNWVKTGTGSASSNAWSLAGNPGTNPSTNFIGTVDNQPLSFRVNNQKAGKIDGALNTFLGYQAGNSNTAGSGNTGIGGYSLYSNTGLNNTANGAQALYFNTIGRSNTANGYFALLNNTTGNNNTASGMQSLQNNTTGYSNVAVGVGTLFTNTLNSNLVAIGDSALFNNRAGLYDAGTANVAVGSKALYSNTEGLLNTAVGYKALYFNLTGGANTAIGSNALYSNGSGGVNTAVGHRSLFANTMGNSNTAIGYSAMKSNINGHYNTAIGERALEMNESGLENTACGFRALASNTYGYSNTALGYEADVDVNNLVNATALGFRAKVNSTNTVQIGNADVTDVYNGSGYTTLHAAYAIIEKSANTYVSVFTPPANESGILFGNQPSTVLGGIIYNNTAFPQDANGIQFRTNGNITRMVLYSNGNAWLQGSLTQYSDIRLKKDIQPISGALKSLLKLSGYTYHWIEKDATTALQSGLIAQEVQKVFPELVSENQGKLGINYSGLIPYMLEAAKEQQMVIDIQNNKLNNQAAQIKMLDEKHTYQVKILNEKIEALSKAIETLSHK